MITARWWLGHKPGHCSHDENFLCIFVEHVSFTIMHYTCTVYINFGRDFCCAVIADAVVILSVQQGGIK